MAAGTHAPVCAGNSVLLAACGVGTGASGSAADAADWAPAATAAAAPAAPTACCVTLPAAAAAAPQVRQHWEGERQHVLRSASLTLFHPCRDGVRHWGKDQPPKVFTSVYQHLVHCLHSSGRK